MQFHIHSLIKSLTTFKENTLLELNNKSLGVNKPKQVYSIAYFAVLFQIILGIVTLMTGVKIYYASLHQLGSVFVLSSFLYIYYKNTN